MWPLPRDLARLVLECLDLPALLALREVDARQRAGVDGTGLVSERASAASRARWLADLCRKAAPDEAWGFELLARAAPAILEDPAARGHALATACTLGSEQALRWLLACGGYSPADLRACSAFAHACSLERTDAARLLWGLDPDEDARLDAFRAASERGGVPAQAMVLELATLPGSEPLPASALLRPFHVACGLGRLARARLLWGLGGANSSGLGAGAAADGLRLACAGGHVLTARWLWSLGGPNLGAGDARRVGAFAAASYAGHMEIVLWLWALGESPDGNAFREDARAIDRVRCRPSVVCWLAQVATR